MDEAVPGTRRTSREFDEFEHRALRGWSHKWDGGFNDVEREAFIPNWRRVVAHVDAADAIARTAPTPQEGRLAKQAKQALRVALIGVFLVAVQIAVNAFDKQTVVVTLPGGQSVTVTPPASTPSTGGSTEP